LCEHDENGSLSSMRLSLAVVNLVVGISAMAIGAAFVLGSASTIATPADFMQVAT